MEQRTLVRSKNNKMIAGVLGGFADRYGWDATWLRLLFIISFPASRSAGHFLFCGMDYYAGGRVNNEPRNDTAEFKEGALDYFISLAHAFNSDNVDFDDVEWGELSPAEIESIRSAVELTVSEVM